MTLFTVALLFSVGLASCHGYSYLIPADMKHPGICYYNGHVLPKGDNQMPTACQNMNCNEDGSILVQGCGRLDLKQCTLVGLTNLAKPYPDCCEMTYSCKNKDGSKYTRQWNALKMGIPTESNAIKEQASLLDMGENIDQLDMTKKSGLENQMGQGNMGDMDDMGMMM